MAFDYKKEYREFYQPKDKPEIIDVPVMRYIAVRGCGNPNEEGGASKRKTVIRHPIKKAGKAVK